MSEPFIGEIKMVAFNFVPVGWLKCDGQSVKITDNSALYSLLGTIYGGDGKNTFCLPNLNQTIPNGCTPGSIGTIQSISVPQLPFQTTISEQFIKFTLKNTSIIK
jgi:microcystin-dependent protein